MQKCIDESLNLSHAAEVLSISQALVILKRNIVERGDLPHVSVSKQLELAEELAKFSFGQYVLTRKGANAYWTDVLMKHPQTGRLTGLNVDGSPLTSLENFIFNRSLITLASQERFMIFQRLFQNALRENISMASVPCGVMRDFLTLDFSKLSSFSLFGVDLDPEALAQAHTLAEEVHLTRHVRLLQQDAWQLSVPQQLDLITSSGLNIYERNRERVLSLYGNFFQSLRNEGVLILGFLTPPPWVSDNSPWEISKIPSEDLFLERVLYEDVLDLKWRNFRTYSEIQQELISVGFKKIDFYPDQFNVFPTVCAQK